MNRSEVKLYQIVVVQHSWYQHYGEVLSRVTPTDTVMVRMTPGHPGTLKEVPISSIRDAGLGMRPMYVHYGAVKGFGAFPTDMLRYDGCAPLNFDPETKVIDPAFGFDCMVMTRLGPLFWTWTVDRWASFGYVLEELTYERFRPVNV